MTSSPRLIFLLCLTVIVFPWSMGWLTSSIGADLSLAVDQVFIMAGLPILIIRASGKNLGFDLKAPPRRFIAAAFFSALALVVINVYLIAGTEYIINVPPDVMIEAVELVSASTIREFLTKTVTVALLPSLVEEIFFRGICQTALSAHYGNRVGIVIVSGFFAMIHLNPWFVHSHFMFGCFAGWIYVTGKTLWLPIICHFVNNFFLVTGNYVGIKLPTGVPIFDAVIATCAVTIFLLMIRQIILLRNSAPRSEFRKRSEELYNQIKSKGEVVI